MWLLSQKVKLTVTFQPHLKTSPNWIIGSKPYLSSPEGVFKKLLSISPFFSKFLKRDSNLLFLIKHHKEEIREGIIKKKLNSHLQDTCGKKNYLLFYPNLFLLVVLTCWKKNTFKISMKFHLKKRKIVFETSLSPSFDVLYS